MSLKHFEIYWDQARKRLCMNHVAGRNGRGKEHIQALFSSSQRLGCLCWTLHQGQRSSSGQQPPLWQSVIQAGSEKWFCSSSTERVSPCSVYPSDWIGAFGWAEETTDNPSLWQPGAIHHLLWLQCWGEAVACSEWSRDEQPLGDVLGALKYLREATRQDGDTGQYLWFLLDLHFLASWLSYIAGKSVCVPGTEGCCGERGRVLHSTQRSREGLYEERPPFTTQLNLRSIIAKALE